MRDIRSADIAWLVIAGSVVVFELTSNDLLSEATERYWTAHPLVTRLVILAVAGHLGGVIPPMFDLFSARNIAHQWLVAHYPMARPDRLLRARRQS